MKRSGNMIQAVSFALPAVCQSNLGIPCFTLSDVYKRRIESVNTPLEHVLYMFLK